MQPAGRRVLDTLAALAQFVASRRIVEECRHGTERDAKHVGRAFALMARDDVRGILADATGYPLRLPGCEGEVDNG